MNQSHILFEKSYTQESIYIIAQNIFNLITQDLDTNYPTIVLFQGNLGLGKTTFIKELGNILGVDTPITSPTFGIMRMYDIGRGVFKRFIHIDAYRLEEEKDVNLLNLKELFTVGENTIIAIEWPSQITSALPSKTFSIILSNHNCNSEDERHIQLVKNF